MRWPRIGKLVRCIVGAGLASMFLGQVVVVATADGTSAPAEQNREQPVEPSADRPSPPHVEPVEIDGIRYQQSMEGPPGFLAAVDVPSGEVRWTLQVYTIKEQDAPLDSMAIYFKSMTEGPGPNKLTIENESGYRYEVDLETRTATQIGTPRTTKPLPPPPPP